ncbi:MAG: hypothetical protein ACLQDV_27780 [Candidatus Binataceae bacterium]
MFSILRLFENPFALNSTIRVWLRSSFFSVVSRPSYVEAMRLHLVERMEKMHQEQLEREASIPAVHRCADPDCPQLRLQRDAVRGGDAM